MPEFCRDNLGVFAVRNKRARNRRRRMNAVHAWMSRLLQSLIAIGYWTFVQCLNAADLGMLAKWLGQA